MTSTADDTGMRRNVVVLSSDSDDDDAPLVVAASGSKRGKKPSRPVVVISSDEEVGEEEEIDCVAIAAAEAEGSAQLAASLGALTVAEKEAPSSTSSATAPPPPLPPVAFGELLLDGAIASQLYPHQREGVAWMSSLASGVLPRGGGASSSSPSSSSPSIPSPRRFHGGILADEMGLGKTRQVAAFLRGAIDSGIVRRALVLAPKTLLKVWAEELLVVGIAAKEFGGSPAERAAALAAVGPPLGSGVLLTTYGMLLHNGGELKGAGRKKKQQQQEQQQEPATAEAESSSSAWDTVIFDEGHCLKNPKTRIAELARSLESKTKILLSGTPVQNDLDELFALFDLVAPGLLAKDAKLFKSEFSTRIVAGSSRSAREGDKAAAAGAARALRERMAPCFLRREKAAVLGVASSSAPSSTAAAGGVSLSSLSGVENAASTSQSATPAALGRKTDLIVWLRLTTAQRDVYRSFLKSDAVAAALNRTGSPLAAVTVLKKICDHPGLLTRRAAAAAVGRKGVEEGESEDVEEEDEDEDAFDSDDDFIDDGDGGGEYKPRSKRTPSPAKGKGKKSSGSKGDQAAATTPNPAASAPPDPAALALEERLLALIAERGASASCKTQFAPKLVSKLVSEGHRVLVFSQSRVMLDIVGAALLEQKPEVESEEGGGEKEKPSLPEPFLRIDGTITSAAARQSIVARFQEAKPGISPPVLLLTTGVGALGLTLTAATRVVLVEPG